MTLIEKLETAVEGSRELDRQLSLENGWYLLGGALIHPDGYGSSPPHYTTSIDAALSLIPEERFWAIGKNLKSGFECILDNNKVSHHGKTPALAICTGVLKDED